MFRLLLAAIIFAMAAFGPAAAYSPSMHEQEIAPAEDQDCECCDEGQLGAAIACAAICQAASSSLMAALPQLPRADLAPSFVFADGDGMTLEPPAPPPRPCLR